MSKLCDHELHHHELWPVQRVVGASDSSSTMPIVGIPRSSERPAGYTGPMQDAVMIGVEVYPEGTEFKMPGAPTWRGAKQITGPLVPLAGGLPHPDLDKII